MHNGPLHKRGSVCVPLRFVVHKKVVIPTLAVIVSLGVSRARDPLSWRHSFRCLSQNFEHEVKTSFAHSRGKASCQRIFATENDPSKGSKELDHHSMLLHRTSSAHYRYRHDATSATV